MSSFETFATVQSQGIVSVTGVPFAAGTQVQVSISRPTVAELNSPANGAMEAARARMKELFESVKGFRMSPKISREELYDRRGLH